MDAEVVRGEFADVCLRAEQPRSPTRAFGRLRLFEHGERCEIASVVRDQRKIASVFAISPVNSPDRILETTKREVSS
jgi:hypothetical protein